MLTYVAYLTERRHHRPIFVSLPSTDRDACIAAVFDAFPAAKTVTSCVFHNRFVTGSDTRWHDRARFNEHRMATTTQTSQTTH